MVFQGEVLTVAALLEAAQSAPTHVSGKGVGVRQTAASNAQECARLLADGGDAEMCWRFGVLQTLDDYTSTLRRGGPELAAGVFIERPQPTGAREVDASFAALATYLAERDGWDVPTWAQDATLGTTAWYPLVPEIFRKDAVRESPDAFRDRGIFITARSLDRA